MAQPNLTSDTSLNGAASDDLPAVELEGITKAYPGVVANDRIDLVVRRGEVHCLLGENGAGKSTLMSILSGMVTPDAGRIRADGREVEIDSPRKAIELGIGMVYQHTTLVPTLSVLENLMLGAGDGIALDVRGSRARLAELAGMLGVDVHPRATAGSLALGQQQQIEIVKALWRGSSVLILDEPTSMLTPQGVAELGKVLERLTGHGLAVVFITHKLYEAISMGDRVTILKQGRVAGSIELQEFRSAAPEELQRRIVALMFGDEERAPADAPELKEQIEGRRLRRHLPAEPLLELDGVSVAPGSGEVGIDDVSLRVRPGEIMGIAGVDGNGQRELAEAIAGQRHVVAGDIRIAGLSVRKLSVARRERLGLRYVTDDRLGEGTVGSLTVGLNLVLKRIGRQPFWRGGRIRPATIERTAQDLIDRFDVRTPGPNARIGTLSGGNTQKVVLARELSFDPKVVVYNKPTYGLDLKTTQAVRDRIREQADQGVTSLVISTDLEELLDLCDRIAVLFRGRVTGVVENAPGAETRIGELMVGGTRQSRVPPNEGNNRG
jgi:simple sugar transport system ATP-binding protein